MKRWTRRPEGSTWGDFGPDDEIGRLNLLTEEKVLQAVREVRAGKVFCLSLPLDLPGGNVLNPRRHPPQLKPTFRDGTPYLNFAMARLQPEAVDVLSDDQVTLSLQYSTQWDGLCHVGAQFDIQGDGQARRVYYNGYAAGVDVFGGDDAAPDACCPPGGTYARKLGITRPLAAVKNTRGGIGKHSMILNDATPKIDVDAETYEVRADGELLTCEPATVLPMAQRYFLF